MYFRQRFLSVIFALSIVLGASTATLAAVVNSFPDVDQTSPFYEAINFLKDQNIIRGYPDGSFQPKGQLNRAEMAKMLIMEQGITPAVTNGCLTDVAGGLWYTGYICEGINRGFWQGYPDGSFQPSKKINRVEAVEMICNIAEWERQTPSIAPFRDAPLDSWFIPCTTYAKEHGYLKNIAGKVVLFPGNEITREEFSSLLYLGTGGGEPVPEVDITPLPLEVGDNACLQVTGNVITPENFQSTKQEMLNLVNAERAAAGLNQVEWSEELSIPAQLHSIDMAYNEFFSHVNLEGESPDDRRAQSGVTTLVGENLACAGSITSAHEGLMNSPPHKENILTPEWERLGIGLAQNTKGALFVTQLFSKFAPQAADLRAIEQLSLQQINSSRNGAAFNALTEDPAQTAVAHEWNRMMMEQNFFALSSSADTELSTLIFTASPTAQAAQMGIMQTNDVDQIITEVIKNSDVYMGQDFSKIGFALDMNSTGNFYGTIIVTN